jgi:hypothetical protein
LEFAEQLVLDIFDSKITYQVFVEVEVTFLADWALSFGLILVKRPR